MEKSNEKITEEETMQLEILKEILSKYNIPTESYIIGEETYKGYKAKICINKKSNSQWNTYIKINDSIFDSTYHAHISAAIIKFISRVSGSEEQYIEMTQEYLNKKADIKPKTKKRQIKKH